MRIVSVLAFIFALAAGVAIGLFMQIASPKNSFADVSSVAVPPKKDEYSDLRQVKRLLQDRRPYEAFAILSGLTPGIDLNTNQGKEWLGLLVDTYTFVDNQSQLFSIHEQFPNALEGNETAALIVANHLLNEKKLQQYHQLRDSWIGRESEPNRWALLDTQVLVLEENPKAAISLLQTHRFRGKQEIDRLLRLAALFVMEDPSLALTYLTEAANQEPQNSDIRLFKASLSETLNRSQAAQTEYITAVQYDPENPHRREQLADFYLRTKQYQQALTILLDTLQEPSLDTIWLKALFWNRMVAPFQTIGNKAKIPTGNLQEFVTYLASLPQGIYWNQQAFLNLKDSQTYLNTRQEAFWLQLMSALKNKQENLALDLLNENVFKHFSWEPKLTQGLNTLLRYRLFHSLVEAQPVLSASTENITNSEQLLTLLANLADLPTEQLSSAIPYSFHDYLLSPEAFVVPFLAVNWTEAALQLHRVETFPEVFPSWVVQAVTQAIQQNRGTRAALNFTLAQKASVPLSLQRAELALEIQEEQIAFNALKEIYTHNSESGRQAALLLGQFLIKHENFPDAKKALLAQPELANSVEARELLARIALEENDLKRAYILYLELEHDSSEAKSFLARKAFVENDWTRARELTEALLQEHPENPVLTDNLQKIIAEEKRIVTTR